MRRNYLRLNNKNQKQKRLKFTYVYDNNFFLNNNLLIIVSPGTDHFSGLTSL